MSGRIRIGTDGLPHCADCTDAELCRYHARQVESAVKTLKTAHTLLGDGAVGRGLLLDRRTRWNEGGRP